MNAKEQIVCRCEEVTLAEIRAAIKHGACDVDAVKRMTRAGMGLCQGKTCCRLVTRLLAAELRIAPGTVRQMTQRLPVRPVPGIALARGIPPPLPSRQPAMRVCRQSKNNT